MQRLPYPYQDDYKALLAFASEFALAKTFSARAATIAITQYNQYRLIFEHLVVATDVALFRRVSFGGLTLFGDAFLLGIFALLWNESQNKSLAQRLLRFLPVSLIFCSLSYWETLNWSMAELQNLPVVFFALWSLWLLNRGTSADGLGRFVAAMLTAVLSCCSSANGFLLAPVGLGLLVALRLYRRAMLWLLCFALPAAAYAYPRMAGQPVPAHSLLVHLLYFIAFFGSVLHWRVAAAVLGMTVLGLFVGLAFRRFQRGNLTVVAWFGWIVLTGALVESIRSEIPSRYSIYSALSLVCVYLLALRRAERPREDEQTFATAPVWRSRFWVAAVALSLILCIQADLRAYHELCVRRAMVLSGLRNYRKDPLHNSPQSNPMVDLLFPDERSFELQMLHRAEQQNLYKVPEARELHGE